MRTYKADLGHPRMERTKFNATGLILLRIKIPKTCQGRLLNTNVLMGLSGKFACVLEGLCTDEPNPNGHLNKRLWLNIVDRDGNFTTGCNSI